jgi:enoyl-CoA hydratase/carnithine racemase
MAIIDILKNMKKHLNVFVPYYSMSGGTMLAMACDKIFMTPIASLGCVDPQVGIWYKGAFSKSSLDFVIQNKKKLASDDTFALKFIASQYEKSIRGLVKKIRPDLPDKTINLMTSGKLEHGFRITPAIAKDMGINAEVITDNFLLKLLYRIHKISGVKTKYIKIK